MNLFSEKKYFDNIWHIDTEVNLQQNCNRLAHLS